MPRLRHPISATAAVAAAALLLSGCSGSTHSSQSSPSFNFGSGAATPGMVGSGTAAAPAPSQSAVASGPEAPPPQPGNAITITNFKFNPQMLTVPAGTTVTWTNQDEEPHTVVAKDGSFHSPGLDTKGTYSFTFAKPGSYDYVCSIHPFMTGTVVVNQ